MIPHFDFSLLPPDPLLSFVVVADTHYMLDPGDGPLEFESRRHQSRRAAAAWRQVAALAPDFVVHLGDLVQEYPETVGYGRAMDEALAQARACCPLPLYHVAGNHDVGDKPDPTMPTHQVSAAGLDDYHRRVGASWYSFDRGPLHGVVLNSQIFNTDMSEARQQRRWLEADLKAAAGRRLALFCHLPPYLAHHDEAGLGNYDTIAEPDRGWLLDLARGHGAELLFAGHVHFAFADLVGPTRYRIVPSTSFTRPGFAHLFSAAPPPERGRDDWPKLGFYWCRVFADRIDLHFIRTSAARHSDDWPGARSDARRVLTPLPASGSGQGLALSLSHPLASETQVPVAFPSVVRQPVRNDYPLLALLELGASAVRFPWTDLADGLQRRRLAVLRGEGVQLQASVLWHGGIDLPGLVRQYSGVVDAWEIQVPYGENASLPPAAAWNACRGQTRLGLAAVVAGERVGGKQHPRSRIGFRPGELPQLEELLRQNGMELDFTLCRLDPIAPTAGRAAIGAGLGRLDFVLPLPPCGPIAERAALAALFAGTVGRLFIEPFIELDRTMDGQAGLLDPLCNPTSFFGPLRLLHAVLERAKGQAGLKGAVWQEEETGAGLALAWHGAGLRLLLSDEERQAATASANWPADWFAEADLCYELQTGTVIEAPTVDGGLTGPLLLCGRPADRS